MRKGNKKENDALVKVIVLITAILNLVKTVIDIIIRLTD